MPNTRRIRILGEGGEGRVWLEQHRATSKYIVCKEPRVWHTIGSVPKEVKIRRDYMPRQHRSLLDFHGFDYTDNRREERLRLYYEYCAGGDLWHLIPDRPAEHPESFIWHVFIQLAEALDAMHHRGPAHVVHCDVKPENVFLKRPYVPGHSYPTIKLGDFGLATRSQVSDPCGTWECMGPEIECSAKGDVWALGASIHTLCHGFGPVDTTRRHWKRDPDARRPKNLPLEYSDVLNNDMMWCLSKHRRDRPNSETLVRQLIRDRPRAR